VSGLLFSGLVSALSTGNAVISSRSLIGAAGIFEGLTTTGSFDTIVVLVEDSIRSTGAAGDVLGGLLGSGLGLHLTEFFIHQAHLDVLSAVYIVEAESDVVLASWAGHALGLLLLEVGLETLLTFHALSSASLAFFLLLGVALATGVHLLTLTVDDFGDFILGAFAEFIPREGRQSGVDVVAFVLAPLSSVNAAYDKLVAGIVTEAVFDSLSAALFSEALGVVLCEVLFQASFIVHAFLHSVIARSSLLLVGPAVG